jgi:general secretion pathway protein L
MTTLRVLLPGPPDAQRADFWTRIDARGQVTDHGRSVPAQWPRADHVEAVIAADAVRIVTLSLPPLPRARLVAAATYALEDRLATPASDAAIAIGERSPDGRVSAIVVARDLADALTRSDSPFERSVAEPQLVPASDGWRWCEGDGGAFVRTADGSAFPVGRPSGDALPPELTLGLASAKRSGDAPRQVIVDRRASAEQLAHWSRECGVAFASGTPWRWDARDPAAHASATDLVSTLRRARTIDEAPRANRYATALGVAVGALALHLIAAGGTLAWQRLALARAEQALVPLAREAGARDASATNASDAIDRQHAEARHRAGLSAPADAMPVLARAAPALATLPAGALKTATWSGGAWTLELAPMDDTIVASLSARLASAGLAVLHARTASGVRARVSHSP